MLGGADNPNGELPSYITGADRYGDLLQSGMYEVCLQIPARFAPGPGVREMRHNYLIMPVMSLPDPDVVRRFVPRTVVHWLCLLMILFMRHSDRGDIDKHHHLWAK